VDSPKLEITKTVFDNGLTLLILEKHDVPIVTSTIWYNVGSANEHQGQTGISHLLEHLMFKGTQMYAKGAIDFLTSAHGGNNNAGTIYDYTMYYFNFSSDRWEIALEIEADRMRNCLFDPDEFEAERNVVLEELKQLQDSPWGELGTQLEATIFPEGHPYHHTPIGWQADLEKVSRETVIAYYKTYYVPNNATIVIVGDIDTQAAIQTVARYFAHIPRGNPIPTLTVANSLPHHDQRFELRQNTTLKRLQIGYRTTTLAAQDTYTLEVIDYLLSHGKTSRFYQRLIEQEQLVTFVDTYNHPRRFPGVFYLFAELRPGIAQEAVEQALNGEIARLQTELVSAEELQKIKNVIAADFTFEKETTSALAHAIGESELLCTYEYLNTFCDYIQQITPAEVQRVATTYFTETNRTVGWSLPQHPEDERKASVTTNGFPSAPLPPEMVFHKPVQRTLQTHRWVLENGLTVLFLENHVLPVVSIEAFVDAGQVYEPEQKAGMAVLTGRLLEEGTTRRSSFEIAQAIESVGGNLRTDSRGVSAQLLSKDSKLGLDMVADILMHPVFAEDPLENQRNRLLGLLASDEDDPALVAHNLFHDMVYGAHPYHRPHKGYKETVQTLTRTDIFDYYTTYFAPNNTVLAIVGDVAPADVLDQVQQYFGAWTRRDLPLKPTFIISRPEGCVTKHLDRDKEQSHLFLGHLGVTRTNPDFYALLTMDHILGTGPGFTDRISRKLRDEQGLAYTVYANITFSAEAEPGVFTAYIGTSPHNVARAIAGFLEEINAIRTERIGPEELELAQNYLTGSYVFNFETSTQLAHYLIYIERFRLGDDFLWQYPYLINSVTIDDIQRVARQYLDPENYYVAIVGPEKEKP
jgi:zinc protease